MFSGGFSIWHWLIVLLIVVLIFGTRRLRSAGSDLGSAVKNFRQAMHEGEAEADKDKERLQAPDPRSADKTESHNTHG